MNSDYLVLRTQWGMTDLKAISQWTWAKTFAERYIYIFTKATTICETMDSIR